MSEHESSSRPHDDLRLTEADLARALATSLDRGHRLVRRRNQRRAALSGLGVVVLLAGGFGVLNSLQDDNSDVIVTPADGSGRRAGDTVLAPTASTTTSPSVPTSTTIPGGYGFSASGRLNTVYDTGQYSMGPDKAAPTTLPNGVALGGGVNESRGQVRSMTVTSPSSLRVEFECVNGDDDRLLLAHYFLRGNEVHIDARIGGVAGTQGCSGGVGVTLDLPFPDGDLPSTVVPVEEIMEG